jgi:DNA-binding HxlR family transcriptional regulator
VYSRSSGTNWPYEVIGDRWALAIVDALLDGPLRYGELSGAVAPIAPNVLASRLRHLERHGLVAADPYQERPRRLQYALTADGHRLAPVLSALRTWAGHLGHGPVPVHDACGTPTESTEWCPTCQQPVAPQPFEPVTWI